jgi:hypothetical protein
MVNHDHAPKPSDLPDHLDAWSLYNERATWNRAIAQGSDEAQKVARHALAELPEVSALDALKANHSAVDLLIGRRWYVIQEARESGATWEEIGAALGITKQGAQDYYRRQIEKQQQYAPSLHDADRAHAALDDGDH